MSFSDYGLIQLGSFIAGTGPTPPNYIAFGSGTGGFIGSENYLNYETFRKAITWSFYQNEAKGTVVITSVEANGSILNEFGLATGSIVGSNLYTRNLTAIGSKNNTFDVNMSFTPKFRRGT